MAVRRLLIVLEDHAEAQMLACDHTQSDDVDFLALQTVEIILGRGARFDLYDLEESTPRTHRLSTLYASQEADSRLLVNGMTLYNGLTRNEFRLYLDGENCETHLLGMGIADDDRRIDTLTLIDHNVPRCRSNELYKYSADDRSRCSFAGRILVRPGAHHTDSYQSNRNLLGSSDARIYSKPQLEIYNDDVKCSHGSATGQLDAMQLFYMRTRGIDDLTARLLLKQAFMADALATVAGACFGTSTTTTYVESAAGVAQGGRSGLTSFVVACCFFVALFFSPLFLAIPSAATAPVLIIVGLFMLSPIRNIPLEDYSESIPAFICVVMMPLAYSISDGILLGMISYVVINVLCGHFKRLTPTMYVLAVLFMLKYVFF